METVQTDHRPFMTSREKVEHYARGLAADAAGDPIMAGAVTLLPIFMSRLPDDPDELDGLLARGAAMLLHLRSDGASRIHLDFPDEDPEVAE